jgi:hypothetical protein
MTTVAPPQRTARPRRRHRRLATALGIALLIVGLTIGLLLAFSGGGTADPAHQGPPAGPAPSASPHPPTNDPCWAKLRGPC